jgi:hypothetical protein
MEDSEYQKEITRRILKMKIALESDNNNPLDYLDVLTVKVAALSSKGHDNNGNLFWGIIENEKKFSDIKNIKNIFDPDTRKFSYKDVNTIIQPVIDIAYSLITVLYYYSESPSGSILNLDTREPVEGRVKYIQNNNVLKEFGMVAGEKYVYPLKGLLRLFYLLLPVMLHSLQFHLRIEINGKKNIMNPDIINSDIDALCTKFFGNYPDISESLAAFLKLGYLKFYYSIESKWILVSYILTQGKPKEKTNKAIASYIILREIADKLEKGTYDEEDVLKNDCLSFWHESGDYLQWKMFIDPFDIYETCMDIYVDRLNDTDQALKMVCEIVAPRIATLSDLPENLFDFTGKVTLEGLFSEIEDKTKTKRKQIFKFYRAWIVAFYYYLQKINGISVQFRRDHQECFENIVSKETPETPAKQSVLDGPDTPEKVEGPTQTTRKTSLPDTPTNLQATLHYVKGILNSLIENSSGDPSCLADFLVPSKHYGSPSLRRRSGRSQKSFSRKNRQGFISEDWCIVWKNQNTEDSAEIALHYYELNLLQYYENNTVPPPHWTIILKDFASADGSSKIKIVNLHVTKYHFDNGNIRTQNYVERLTEDSPLHHLSKLTGLGIEQIDGKNEFFLIVPKEFSSNLFNSLRVSDSGGGSASSGCMVLAMAFVTLTSALAGAFSYSGGG